MHHNFKTYFVLAIIIFYYQCSNLSLPIVNLIKTSTDSLAFTVYFIKYIIGRYLKIGQWAITKISVPFICTIFSNVLIFFRYHGFSNMMKVLSKGRGVA